jgi:predicted Zn-ribbon and HTH transcriptional regulator
MSRRLNKWCAGATICQDCLTERREKQKAEEAAKREAEAERSFAKGTLWGDLPWQVILMWDWSKNDVAPWEVRKHSRQFVHLVCPKCGYEFECETRLLTKHFATTGRRRKAQEICECCAGKILVRGVNDLATTHPIYADHWHPTKNGSLTPQDITAKYEGSIWWLYDDGSVGKSNLRTKIKDGNGFMHSGANCEERVSVPVSITHPHLVPQWDIAKNGSLSPDDFTYGSRQMILWTCPDCGYEWKAAIKTRAIIGSGCPKCALKGASKGEDLVTAALDHLGLYYKVEKRFDSCRYKAPLPFDFAILDEETSKVLLLIEYQGRQHEDAIEIWGGEEGLAYRKKCDQIKREWCLANGVPLLEIWHTDDTYQAVLSAICRKITSLIGGIAA